MTLAIDAILIFAAVLCIWAGTRKGFVRSVMGLISTLVAAIAAYAYTPVLAAFIRDRYLIGRITDGIDETLRSLAFDTSTDLFNLDRVAADLPEPFTAILSRYRIDLSAIVEKMRGFTGVDREAVRSVASDIAGPTANALASAISFLLLFIGAIIVLSLLTLLLDAIFRLPVLKGANTFFGFLFGVLEAAVMVSVLAIVISVLTEALGAFDPALFGPETVDRTVVCRFLLQYNLFDKIYAVLR
ncbi:MAG: CvpA family protein [Clostridia bacterium]|nr:CvpA family protein [Clostridia bacterium]MCR4905743.1 CvpA family protein [Clostridiales bacterium]